MIIILVLLMILVLKKVSHNMVLMSKCKGQHGGKKGQQIRARPPPLFGQCPKEIDFFMGGVPLWECFLLGLGAQLKMADVGQIPIKSHVFLRRFSPESNF